MGPYRLLRLELPQPGLQLLVLLPEEVVLAAQLVELILQVGDVLLLLLARQTSRLTVLDHPLLPLESPHLKKSSENEKS